MTDECFLTKCAFCESSVALAFYRLKLECAGVHERCGPLGEVRLESGQQREEGQRSCCLFLLQLFFWASKRKVKKFESCPAPTVGGHFRKFIRALSRTLKPLGVRHRTGAGVFCTHMPAAPPGRILKAPHAMTERLLSNKMHIS